MLVYRVLKQKTPVRNHASRPPLKVVVNSHHSPKLVQRQPKHVPPPPHIKTTLGPQYRKPTLPPIPKGSMLGPCQGKSSEARTKPEYMGTMRPRNGALHHAAADDLLRYATNGCPVDCGRDWTIEEMQAAIEKGPHISALDPVAITALRAETLERVAEGLCRRVPWNTIKENPPPNLKISPLAAIPHKSRSFRMILDLSYELKVNNNKLRSVNDASDKSLAPQHAMFELGNVIPRIIWQMASAPDNGVPLLFSKIDLKDGYWRMVVDERDSWNFAYVLPPEHPTDQPELIIPDALQMGWSESPPFFCAATETARDIADTYYRNNDQLPPHPDEKTVMNIDWTNIPRAEFDKDAALLHLLEVYIDDFIAMIQCTDIPELTRLTRCILHGITDIFPPPDVSGSTMGPPISTKKLEDEGAWEIRKEILGWVLDGLHRTIQLPAKKCQALRDTLRQLRRTEYVKVNDLQKIQGRLQFTAIGIPLGKPLLAMVDNKINHALSRKRNRVKVDAELRTYSTNWAALLALMESRPSHVKELTRRNKAAYQGFVDASKWGVGGVWFKGTKNIAPFVWFYEWPQSIRDRLCTDANPKGDITISDLELLGVLMHWLALEHAVGTEALRHQSPAIWCDNMSAVSWIHKFRTATSRIASNILRALATRLHVCHSGLLSVDHISGLFNVMADVASRKHTTNLTDFLKTFSSKFPPPQKNFWQLFQFSTKLTTRICSELLTTTSTMESWNRLSKKGHAFSHIGADGCLVTTRGLNLDSKTSHAKHKSRYWVPTLPMLDMAAFQSENSKYAPKRSRWHFGPSPRRCNWRDNLVPWLTRKENIQKRLASYWKDTKGTTRPQNQN